MLSHPPGMTKNLYRSQRELRVAQFVLDLQYNSQLQTFNAMTLPYICLKIFPIHFRHKWALS